MTLSDPSRKAEVVIGIERPIPLLETRALQVAEAPPSADASNGDAIELPAPSPTEDLLADYRYTGLTLGPHPMAILREKEDFSGFRTADELEGYRQGQLIRIAGLVTGRQRPGTATGVVFMTIEDETGNVNVVVWSSIMERFRAAILQGQLLKVKGVVEREGTVIHVVAGHIEDATGMLKNMAKAQLPFKSRDFH